MAALSEGANYQTEVFVNGKSAGTHEGGHVPFSIPIHHLLEFDGKDVIAVTCDNTTRPDRVPGGQFGWWNHGGLYRDVSLRVMDLIFIETVGTSISLSENSAKLEVDVQIRSELGAESTRGLKALLSSPDDNTVFVAQLDTSPAMTQE